MIKDANRGKMINLLAFYHTNNLSNTNFLMKLYEKICKSLILLTKTINASVLKLVNRQDLKSCGW